MPQMMNRSGRQAMAEAASAPNDNQSSKKKEDGFIGKRIRFLFDVIAWVFFALALSVLLEWVGIFLSWWDQPGALHSEVILSKELGWLNQDFATVLGSPAATSLRFSRTMYEVFFVWFDIDLAALLLSVDFIAPIAAYFKASFTVIQLFFVRLVIITFSLPVFIVFSLVALVDGAGVRDIRRFCLDREKAWQWHVVMSWIKPLVVVPFIVYLGSPWSIHPNWIILPFALMLSLALWFVASTFKKYA